MFLDEINWPEGEDTPPPDAQELITLLLRQNPLERLGTGANPKREKETLPQLIARLRGRQKQQAAINPPLAVSVTAALLIIPSHPGRN